jgi:ParB family chromosome partitioning protein
MMELELGHLDLRYEPLRRRNARREHQLLASLSERGQVLPVVVLKAENSNGFVLLDGYKRVRALRRLCSDTVQATLWDLGAADALLLERLMRSSEADSPLEQGWLLVTLRDEYGLSLDELSRRFDRSKSWVSRRLALCEQLPDIVQQHVRQGILAPHAAMKFLVPLARANKSGCIRLCTAVTRPLSIRQTELLCLAYKAADEQGRTRLCQEPALFLRALDVVRKNQAPSLPQSEILRRDIGALAGIARRLTKHLQQGYTHLLDAQQRIQLSRAFSQAKHHTDFLFDLGHKELADARPQHAPSHLTSA